MGLRYFHILLIFTAVIFGLGFGFFSFHQYQLDGTQVNLFSAIGSWAMAAAFSVYLFFFIRRNILK